MHTCRQPPLRKNLMQLLTLYVLFDVSCCMLHLLLSHHVKNNFATSLMDPMRYTSCRIRNFNFLDAPKAHDRRGVVSPLGLGLIEFFQSIDS